MIKIKDAVDGVIYAMQLRGCREESLRELKWSIYTPIIRYHFDNGTEVCSEELLEEISKKHEERYAHGEISRKYYRSFVTAAFRIRSYSKVRTILQYISSRQ